MYKIDKFSKMNSLQIRFGDETNPTNFPSCRRLVVETGFVQSKNIMSYHTTQTHGWWFYTNPSEKICSIFPKVRGENKKYLKPPPGQSLDPAKTLEKQWILKVHKRPLIKIVMKTFPLLQGFGRPEIVAAVQKKNFLMVPSRNK